MKRITFIILPMFLHLVICAETVNEEQKLLMSQQMMNGLFKQNQNQKQGDVNYDEKVTVDDLMAIVNLILGKSTNYFDDSLVDVNGDGTVNVSDLVMIVNSIMKSENIATQRDTLHVSYHGNSVNIVNPCPDRIQTSVSQSDVTIVSTGKRPWVCVATGSSDDGRLVINNDTTVTLVLADLHLSSQKSSAISFTQKQKVQIELAKGTTNTLSDAAIYQDDETDSSNACLYSKGSLTFAGEGTLELKGNYRHAIASSKNVCVEGCHIIVDDVAKNGIHCDKFTLKKGQVDLYLKKNASKGIKTKEELAIKGGSINGKASSGITIENGDVSYCALLKSDSLLNISDGAITLKHSGEGGRCISADGNMNITGGVLSLECYGDGGKYTNENNEEDYYTPKCITVDDSVFVNSGKITCLSTGLGGKGIVAGKFLSIGKEQKDDQMISPIIRVDTKGECIINNVDEDLRFGCPKGIKSDSTLIIYDGNIAVTTAGMGGEGVECNGKMYIKGGMLECNTFDDGINVGKSIEISGGQIYCNSVDNDGIDSNGSITISGGIVASVNQHKPNESFDSEGGQLSLLGGIVFGIGSGSVEVNTSAYPCYSTPYNRFGDGPWDRGLILTEDKYVYVQKDGKAVMALRNENNAIRSFITIMSPSFSENEQYTISEGECPQNANHILWDKLYIDCVPNNDYPIAEIKVETK